jgi:hypothetical protein
MDRRGRAESASLIRVPTKEQTGWDRRRHVRVRPAADYDVRVEVVEGAVYSRVDVVDMSLGGLGILIEPPVDTTELGAVLELRIATPVAEPVRAVAVVRHRARGVCGVEFQQLGGAALAALEIVVGELLERGNQA